MVNFNILILHIKTVMIKNFFKKMKSPLQFVMSTMLLMTIICMGHFLGACSDDDDVKSNSIIQTLKSNKWISRDASFTEGSGYHAWLNIQTDILYFTSENTGVNYYTMRDYDSVLGNDASNGYTFFEYQVSGNEIIITNEENYTLKLYLKGNYLTSESGSIYYEASMMTSNDYEFIDSLGPKTGSCGSNLSYSFDDRTKELTISGTGRMKDYTASNQPWHDFEISEIIIKEGCTYVGTHAFHSLTYAVGDVDLPNSLEEIGDYAFCDMLIDKFMVPTKLEKIGDYAFSDCTYLKKVNFSGCDALEEIGNYAFYSCPIKDYLFIPANLKKIGKFAFQMSTFSGVEFNDKIESIGDCALGTINNSKLDIPNSVKTIGSCAFYGTFSEIRIGTGLTTIGNTPFMTSESGKMYVNLANPVALPSAANQYVIATDGGGDGAKTWTLYVPKGSKSAYQKATGWKSFKSIIEESSLIPGEGGDAGDNTGDDEENEGGETENINVTTVGVELNQPGATLTGNVSSNATYVGFVIGLTRELSEDSGLKIKMDPVKGDYTYKMWGLTERTTYYYRAYAIKEGKYYWGDIKSFTTPATSPYTYTVNGNTYGMVLVEGGTMQPFYIMQTEIPVSEMDLDGNGKVIEAECRYYIKSLGNQTGKPFRLPTQEEWEYAARGGQKSAGYTYSGSNSIGDVAWYSGNSGGNVHDIATKAPNELGLYDMSGNYAEFCASKRKGLIGGLNQWGDILCGGSWKDAAGKCKPSSWENRPKGGQWIVTLDPSYITCRLVYSVSDDPSLFNQ